MSGSVVKISADDDGRMPGRCYLPCNGVCLRGTDGGCFRQFMQQQPCAAFHFFRFGSFQYFFVNVFIGLCQFVGLQMVVDKGNRIFIQFEFIQYGAVVTACIVQDTCG